MLPAIRRIKKNLEIERIIVVADRERVIAKAKSLIDNPERYTRSTSFGAAGYVKNKKFSKSTGEIEESFKMIKSEFKARPVFVKTEDHVNAHFPICYVALVIMRTIEHLLEEQFTAKQIRNALTRYSCSYLNQNYYLFDYRNQILDAFSEMFKWNLSAKYMSRAAIKKNLSNTAHFIRLVGDNSLHPL